MIFMARHRLPQELIYERVAQIAFIAMAFAMFDRMMTIPRSIVFALLPKITGIDQEDALRWTLKASRYNILFTLVVFLILFFLIEPIAVLFFGKEFAPMAEPFQALAPGAIFLSLGEVLAAGLFARGKANSILLAGILALFTATFVGWFWLHSWGIFGGTLAATLGFFVYALSLLISFAMTIPFKGKEMFILSDSDVADLKRKLKKQKPAKPGTID
jgi:O-antigen/teichoic acid export membrane protein